jgi:hypothetical protein
LPALRCFIFFAADLFILILHPSIGNPGGNKSGVRPYLPR